MKAMSELLISHENWLIERIIQYAKQQHYFSYMPSLPAAWRQLVQSITGAILEAVALSEEAPEFGPDESNNQGIAAIGIREARKHRERGVELRMFLGMFMYVRQSYLDLMRQADFPRKTEERYRYFVKRCFDHIELGFVSEWVQHSEEEKLRELQTVNRQLAGEKSKYSALFESLPHPILLIDSENRIESLNQAATELIKYAALPVKEKKRRARTRAAGSKNESPEPIEKSTIGRGVGDLWPWLRPLVDEFRQSERDTGMSTVSVLLGRQQHYFSVILTRSKDLHGDQANCIAILFDITQLQETENALRESEHLYRALFDNAGDAIFFYDLAGQILEVNRVACERLGYPREELLRLNIADLNASAFAMEIPERLELVRQTGTAVFVTEHRCRDGRAIDVEVNAQLFDYHGQPAVLSIARDITDRKKNEQAFRESEERYRQLVEYSTDVIYRTDADGRFTYVNPMTERLFGFDESEILGRGYLTLVHPDEKEKVRDFYLRQDREKITNTYFEFSCLTKNGRRIWIAQNVQLLLNEGRRTGFQAIARDISAQKEQETEVLHAKETAESASRAKSEFLANMSHELRTPLNSIIGFSEIMEAEMGGKLSEKQRWYSHNIKKAGKHLLRLIDDILDLSKVEAGKMDLQRGVVSLAELMESAMVMFRERVLKHHITLNLDFQPEIVALRIFADERKIKQILYNLLSNAVKFTPDGGEITLRAAQRGTDLIVSVIDTGIGIRREDQARIFEEFEQVKNATVRDQRGTGLGLAVTKKLVELHGGQIQVSSDGEGKGSIFTFSMPLLPPPVVKLDEIEEVVLEPATYELSPEAADGSRPLILVVEDNRPASDLLTEYLEDAGYAVARAFDGNQALELARRLRPMAITLDIFLPNKDGLQVLAKLKSLPEVKDIPVVIVSISERQQRAYTLGAIDWLVKPVDREQFVRIINSFREGRRRKNQSLLIIDHNPQIVNHIVSLLQPYRMQIIHAADGGTGIRLAKERHPDFIIMELAPPTMKGLEIAGQLRDDENTKEIPVMIYTMEELTVADKRRISRHGQNISTKAGRDRLLDELDKISEIKKARV